MSKLTSHTLWISVAGAFVVLSAILYFFPTNTTDSLGADRVTDGTRATTTLTIRERLATATVAERIDIKSTEIAKIDSVARERVSFSGAEYDIEIVDIKRIEGGVEVFARAWMPDGQQIGFGEDGSVDIERFRIFNPPILTQSPTGEIIQTIVVDDATGETITRRLTENPRAAIKNEIAYTIGVKQQKFVGSKIVPGKVGNTTSTFRSTAGTGSAPIDGYVVRTFVAPGTWSSIRTGSGNGSDATVVTGNVRLRTTADAGQPWHSIFRETFVFDTSSIADTDTISSATFSVRGTSRTDNFNQDIVMDKPTLASASSLSNSDYDIGNWASVAQATARIDVTSWSTSGFNDFTLNATGIGNISKTSYSYFGLRGSGDFDNSTPTWVNNVSMIAQFYYSDQTGTDDDPKLVVEHAAAGGGVVRESVWDDD